MKKTRQHTLAASGPRPRSFQMGDVGRLIKKFNKQDANSFRSRVLHATNDLVDDVVRQMEQSITTHNGILVRTDIENVSLRIRTIGLILDQLSRAQPQDHRDKALKSAGLGAGMTFFYDLVNYLSIQKSIPEDYEAFLALWGRYDQEAGLGAFSFHRPRKDLLEVVIQQSFLARASGDHRYCDFFVGYTRAVLESLFFFLPRWQAHSKYLPVDVVQLVSIEEDTADSERCVFRCVLADEQLPRSRQLLFETMSSLACRDMSRAVTSARSTIEAAFKERIGIDIGDHGSLHSLVKAYSGQFKEWPIAITSKRVRDTYAILCKQMHPSDGKALVAVPPEDVFGEVAILVGELGRLAIRQSQCEQILRVMADERRGKS